MCIYIYIWLIIQNLEKHIDGLPLEIDTHRHFRTCKQISELVRIFLNKYAIFIYTKFFMFIYIYIYTQIFMFYIYIYIWLTIQYSATSKSMVYPSKQTRSDISGLASKSVNGVHLFTNIYYFPFYYICYIYIII